MPEEASIDELVRRLEDIPDAQSRESARALVEAILKLHSSGLERMMDIIFDAGQSGKTIMRRLAGDSLASSLLVLHGLHPDDLETRVIHAMGKARLDAELVSVLDGVIRVRLTNGACGLKDSTEAVLKEAAPDAVDIVIEEFRPSSGFVSISSIAAAVTEHA